MIRRSTSAFRSFARACAVLLGTTVVLTIIQASTVVTAMIATLSIVPSIARAGTPTKTCHVPCPNGKNGCTAACGTKKCKTATAKTTCQTQANILKPCTCT